MLQMAWPCYFSQVIVELHWLSASKCQLLNSTLQKTPVQRDSTHPCVWSSLKIQIQRFKGPDQSHFLQYVVSHNYNVKCTTAFSIKMSDPTDAIYHTFCEDVASPNQRWTDFQVVCSFLHSGYIFLLRLLHYILLVSFVVFLLFSFCVGVVYCFFFSKRSLTPGPRSIVILK